MYFIANIMLRPLLYKSNLSPQQAESAQNIFTRLVTVTPPTVQLDPVVIRLKIIVNNTVLVNILSEFLLLKTPLHVCPELSLNIFQEVLILEWIIISSQWNISTSSMIKARGLN